MSQFQKLLAELKQGSDDAETLVKALPTEGGEDDEAIQAAAAAEGADAKKNPEDAGGEGEGEGEGQGGEGEGSDAPVAKSMTATIDGKEVEAIDATELLKSLDARLGSQESVLVKALETMISTTKAQGVLIKSLTSKVEKLAGTGAGRKAVLSIVEKPDAAGEGKAVEEQGMSPQIFMAKSTAAFEAKKITGKELTTIDVALRTGQVHTLDQPLIAKVLS